MCSSPQVKSNISVPYLLRSGTLCPMNLRRIPHLIVALGVASLLAACGTGSPAPAATGETPVETAPSAVASPATALPEPVATVAPAVFGPDADPALPPLNLSAGFWPDPQRLSVEGGGPVDASAAGESCTGYASVAPNVIINYDGFGFVRFLLVGDLAAQSASLLVRTPARDWRCASGHVEFEDAASGSYQVWVAAPVSGTVVSGTLVVTELRRLDTAALLPTATYPGPVGGALDPAAPADTDNIPLPRKLDPDPLAVPLVAGGGVDVPAAISALHCAGYASVEPDARFSWEGVGFLRFFFLPENGGDTALAIHAPDGSWWCIDDTYGTLDPSLDFLNSSPGEYAVWVTTDQPYEQVAGTLYVTLWDNHPGTFVPSPGK